MRALENLADDAQQLFKEQMAQRDHLDIGLKPVSGDGDRLARSLLETKRM